jgi:cyclopropane fatty-acyl-phospholipid synthase-like methyltransferase
MEMTDMDRFDAFYNTEQLSFGEAPSEEIRDLVSATGLTGKALDLGAGDGRNALYLAKAGFDVTAVDTSEVGLEKLRRFAADRGVADRITTVHGDARTWTYPEDEFDLIASVTLFDHLPGKDVDSVIAKVTASLKAGGILYTKAHTVDDPGYGHSGTESELSAMIRHYFERNELLRLMMQDYYIIRYEETRERDTTHGAPHYHGFAKLLARKLPFEDLLLPLNLR